MAHRVDDELLATVPGWLLPTDARLIRWFLGEQERLSVIGDLAEMGAYLGQSAVLIGDYLNPGETFTVVDLFGHEADADGNRVENEQSYDGLTQAAFENNYLRVHRGALPTVVRGYSRAIVDHARLGTHRFVHVDASHLYEHVREDIAATRQLAQGDGVLVFDDISMAHTPGVAAAVWEAVTQEELNVIAVTPGKLYGTWSSADKWIGRLTGWLPTSGLLWERQEIAGRPLVLVGTVTGPEPARVALRRGRAKRLALALTPPAATDAARQLRARRRG